jgi:hypothetical protein
MVMVYYVALIALHMSTSREISISLEAFTFEPLSPWNITLLGDLFDDQFLHILLRVHTEQDLKLDMCHLLFLRVAK